MSGICGALRSTKGAANVPEALFATTWNGLKTGAGSMLTGTGSFGEVNSAP